ncbi:MAG: TlpA family protein disulfide reductase [Candidatus Omnitrophica bacterium]|nr:TlpA family protein disulfide reductase [Candidatus Omnitrophota bacterium]
MRQNSLPGKLISLFAFACFALGSMASAAHAGAAEIEYQDFSLNSIEGKSVSLSGFKGKNPVLLVFFATWCPPCRREVPELIELEKQYASKGLEIVAINVDEPLDTVQKFAAQQGINYTVVLDPGARVTEMYHVQGIPMNILFDQEGHVRHAGHGLPPSIEDVL